MPTQETRIQNTKMRISIISFGFKHGLPKEGKAQLTLGAGCTGRRHRSLVIAEEIFADLKYFGRDVSLTHRYIGLG